MRKVATNSTDRPRLAILFWCYKDVHLCVKRIQLLRLYNPGVPLYVLYSGRAIDSQLFATAMEGLADDFYSCSLRAHSAWRWLNGDLIVADWHRMRGRSLNWDTVVLVQWDMLVLGHVADVFRHLKRDEILLSGTRPIAEVEDWWGWTKRDDAAHRTRYEQFLAEMKSRFAFSHEPLCCVFVVACLPRAFLDPYESEASDSGFLEYRVPIYAQALGIPFADASKFSVWIQEDPGARWYHLRARALNGFGREISNITMLFNLAWPWGTRLFHPVRRSVPDVRGPALASVVAMSIGRGSR